MEYPSRPSRYRSRVAALSSGINWNRHCCSCAPRVVFGGTLNTAPTNPNSHIPSAMALNITLVSDETGEITTTLIQGSDKVQALNQKVYTDLRIPPAQQNLQHNGTPLDPQKTVSASGLSDGDLVMVHRQQAQPPAQSPMQPPAPNTPAGILASLRSNPTVMSRIRAANPALHSRVQAGDISALQEVVNLFQQPQPTLEDPMSADAQRQIEERIRQENVEQNLHAAMEHNPESFGSVVMLFVDCKINSQPIKAFVDSGAQTTIIAKACAEKCNILRLLDTRFAGVARGVGTAEIHGRIHLALLTLENEVFEVSLTVMDAVGGEYDMLLGLDMLRKHQACIDLRNNCLRIGQSAVPFLAEKDIPSKMRGQKEALPQPAQGGSATAPPVASTTTQQPPTSQSPSFDNETVKRLQDLGFSRDEAIRALTVCHGNVDQAAAMLTAQKYGLF